MTIIGFVLFAMAVYLVAAVAGIIYRKMKGEDKSKKKT